MKILVISIAVAQERIRFIGEQLKMLKLTWERVQGVDGNLLEPRNEELIDWEEQKRLGLKISLGAMGCWLSHRRACQIVADGNNDMVLILEDDVKLDVALPAFLTHVESGQVGDFDIIRLHRFKPWRKYVPLRNIGNGYTLGLVKPVDVGAQAYIITRNAARRLIQKVPRMVYRNDWTMNRYRDHGLIVCALNPPVVSHADGGYSLIAERLATGRERLYGWSQVLDWLRRRKTHLLEDLYRRLAYRTQLSMGQAGRLSACNDDRNLRK